MAASPKPIRILMLHGYTQSGPLFHAKTRALEKQLKKAFPSIQLSYPTAPIEIKPADLPEAIRPASEDSENHEAYGWWRRKDEGGKFYYRGIEDGLARVAETIEQEGPFDGVMGFSQGGALAGMVVSLLESGRQDAFRNCENGMPFPSSWKDLQPPMKFGVSYSGFGPTDNELYRGLYEPPIITPMLHFLGSVDTVVEESRSLKLVDACVEGRGKDGKRLVYHPGSHFLPCGTPYVAPLVAFIKEVAFGDVSEEKEERVEDMDVPF